jgi:hypothetical protein
MSYEVISKCPITDSQDKISYFDLGNFPLVNNLNISREESLNCERYPLSIDLYTESKLTSLSCVVDGEKLFSNYLFKSEVNRPYIEHCKVMFNYIDSIVNVKDDDLIVDIGGNDGTLLNAFKDCKKIVFQRVRRSSTLKMLLKSRLFLVTLTLTATSQALALQWRLILKLITIKL